MDKKSIIYIGIASIFCLTVFYYFYKGSFDLSKDIDHPEPVEQQPKYPSFVPSKNTLKQADKVPNDQDELKKSDEEEEEEESELDIESFFDGWTIQRNGLGDVMSVGSDDREKNLPLPDAESQTASVLLLAQEMAPLFGGSADQIGGSSVTETSSVKHYFYKQVIDDYEVYSGGLQISVLQDSQSVFNVNNSMKEINVENFNTNLNYDREQAWERLRSELSSATTQINAEQYQRPQLFIRNSVQELAWVFDVRFSQSDVRRVVVGGVSGSILENFSTIVH